MRRFILAGSLALCLTTWSAPAPGAAMATPVQATLGEQEEQSNPLELVMDAGDRLRELMLDRLTIPLGLADQNVHPVGILEEGWIGAQPSIAPAAR